MCGHTRQWENQQKQAQVGNKLSISQQKLPDYSLPPMTDTVERPGRGSGHLPRPYRGILGTVGKPGQDHGHLSRPYAGILDCQKSMQQALVGHGLLVSSKLADYNLAPRPKTAGDRGQALFTTMCGRSSREKSAKTAQWGTNSLLLIENLLIIALPHDPDRRETVPGPWPFIGHTRCVEKSMQTSPWPTRVVGFSSKLIDIALSL
ncbi:hypothetical protein K2173_012274 [Erythroxylum novogranatense]|uniref:Uncharacterized protein n=1 Tax=Erythroxylum novogranatense TaxID=1862640 RepID=A0AAV8SCD5_9ROSI|nr:hypothetical protein K2173_012274 [Erythroxylum novogranatense]